MTEETVKQEGPKASEQVYKLKRKWTWWYLNDERMKNWEERLKNVHTFGSVGEFWALYDAIKPPSGLNMPGDYNVFKDGIEPMWEVPENMHGGRWLITIERGRLDVTDIIWLEILMGMMGEQFGEDMESVCGLVCQVRPKGSKISMWTRKATDDAANLRIGQVLKRILNAASLVHHRPLFEILRYEDHHSCQKKQNSGIKAMHFIHAVEVPEEKIVVNPQLTSAPAPAASTAPAPATPTTPTPAPEAATTETAPAAAEA